MSEQSKEFPRGGDQRKQERLVRGKYRVRLWVVFWLLFLGMPAMFVLCQKPKFHLGVSVYYMPFIGAMIVGLTLSALFQRTGKGDLFGMGFVFGVGFWLIYYVASIVYGLMSFSGGL
jgi:hypothetical protein